MSITEYTSRANVVALNQDGKRQKFMFHGKTDAEIRRIMVDKSLHLESINRTTPTPRAEMWTGANRISFVRALNAALKRNNDPRIAVMETIEAEKGPGKRLEMEPALAALRRGNTSLTEVFRKVTALDETSAAILGAGEHISGGVKLLCEQLLEYLAVKREMFNEFRKAVFFIGMEFAILYTSAWGLALYGTDDLMGGKVAADNPAAVFTVNAILYMFLVLSTASIGLLTTIYCLSLVSTEQFRNLYTKLVNRTPLIRGLLSTMNQAETMIISGQLMTKGVRFEQAVTIARDSAYMSPVAEYWAEVLREHKRGVEGAEALGIEKGILHPHERMALTANKGQATVNLGKAILAISKDLQERAQEQGRRATATITYLFISLIIILLSAVAYVAIVQDDFLGNIGAQIG